MHTIHPQVPLHPFSDMTFPPPPPFHFHIYLIVGCDDWTEPEVKGNEQKDLLKTARKQNQITTVDSICYVSLWLTLHEDMCYLTLEFIFRRKKLYKIEAVLIVSD